MVKAEEDRKDYRLVQFWYKGRWHETYGLVLDKDLCKNPDCNRIMPSYRSGYSRKKGGKIGYCTPECFEEHQKNGRSRNN